MIGGAAMLMAAGGAQVIGSGENPAQPLIDHFGGRLIRAYSTREPGGAFQDGAGSTPALSGDPVGGLRNWAGNGITAEASGGERPTLGVHDGVLSVVFNGTTNFLSDSTFSPGASRVAMATDYLWPDVASQTFVAVAPENTGGVLWVSFVGDNGPTNGLRRRLMVRSANATGATARRQEMFLSPDLAVRKRAIAFFDRSFSAGDLRYWEDAVENTSPSLLNNNHSGTGNVATATMMIGANSGASFFAGHFSRLAVVTGAISSGDVDVLDPWSAWS